MNNAAPVLTARQLESSLIITISTSMGQRGYNGVIDHLWGNQSMRLLTKLPVIVPELSGRSVAQQSGGVRDVGGILMLSAELSPSRRLHKQRACEGHVTIMFLQAEAAVSERKGLRACTSAALQRFTPAA